MEKNAGFEFLSEYQAAELTALVDQIVPADERLRTKKRYRVHIDDHSGIIEVRNITPLVDDQVRLGIAFKSLGLELQELVVDSLATARVETSRLADTG